MNALQSNLARSLQANGVTVPPNTTNLTRIQRDTMQQLLRARPRPVRGGYGSDDMSGTTGNSLVGRGLAIEAARPEGGKRGTYYTLTQEGIAEAHRYNRQAAW